MVMRGIGPRKTGPGSWSLRRLPTELEDVATFLLDRAGCVRNCVLALHQVRAGRSVAEFLKELQQGGGADAAAGQRLRMLGGSAAGGGGPLLLAAGTTRREEEVGGLNVARSRLEAIRARLPSRSLDERREQLWRLDREVGLCVDVSEGSLVVPVVPAGWVHRWELPIDEPNLLVQQGLPKCVLWYRRVVGFAAVRPQLSEN